LKEVTTNRSHYSTIREASGIRIGYELKDVPRNHFIAFENIPLGGLSQSILFGGDVRTKVTGTFIIDSIRGVENLSGRMLTQTQAEGVTMHACKRMLYSYSATYVALFGGAYLAFRGRKEMKFPFMKPKSLDRYNNFPNRYLPILPGNYARFMWHITRGFVYMGLGALILSPIFNSMGMTTMMVGMYRDDRTQDLMKDLKGPFNRISSNMAEKGAPGQTAPPAGSYRTDSPSGFSETNMDSTPIDKGGDSAFIDSTVDTSIMSDSTMPPVERRQPAATDYDSSSSYPSRNRHSSRRPPTPKPQQEREPDSDFFFDDASPTAGNDPDMATPASRQPSGSSWEKIRRGVSGQPSAQNRSQTQAQRQLPPSRVQTRDQNATSAESFSFSSSDEDKQLAKQQAQKEFDEMLERERKESGSGDYASGMYAAQQGRENPNGSGSESAWERRRRG
jgi:hypothetical protein